ncbi:MAG: PAS domain S-box protein [Desulfobulbaceae bacterium]|uniref:histidine kinase n=1 Tax=Candidatus Desulfatifera sulfidica TaxID=2841691 RepID=A0A8J6TD18_9BACT|nr:PAS domain S-box protein [Candidatus Desulfatifera sulfidica]
MHLRIKQRLTLVSPWLLAAACALLALIIGVFAVNNYHREKGLMTDALLEKGATLIRFVTSSARGSFFEMRRGQEVTTEDWIDHVQQVLIHVSEDPGVQSLVLVDPAGIILASSMEHDSRLKVDPPTLGFISNLDAGGDGRDAFAYRLEQPGQGDSFQVAALFTPLGRRQLEQQRAMSEAHGGEMMGRMMRRHQSSPERLKALDKIARRQFVLLVELDMTEFNTAVRQQRLQIVILSLVLLLVGIGGWLSLLTLQGLKGSEVRLASLRAFRDSLIASLPMGLIATDSQGQIMTCNQFAEQVAAVQENKVVGKVPGVVLPPLLALEFDHVRNGNSGSEQMQKEITLTDRDGVQRALRLSRLAVLGNEGQSSGIMLLMQDLSQVKELERELRRSERMAALGKMAAGVAHELRNPLSSIKGLAVLLRSRFQERSSDRETADILVSEVERLNRSISELLDYARPQQLTRVPVRIDELLAKASSLLAMDAEAIGIAIELDVASDVPEILADPDKLNQVFLNLLLNGIQAMDQGGVLVLRVSATTDTLEIQIEDTGCGISEENQNRIFDPYFTTKPEGTGLGLAMSAKIIEEHGGSIELRSEEGTGTTMTVHLPLGHPGTA